MPAFEYFLVPSRTDVIGVADQRCTAHHPDLLRALHHGTYTIIEHSAWWQRRLVVGCIVPGFVRHTCVTCRVPCDQVDCGIISSLKRRAVTCGVILQGLQCTPRRSRNFGHFVMAKSSNSDMEEERSKTGAAMTEQQWFIHTWRSHLGHHGNLRQGMKYS
eukprot:5483589-Amphidinium_carterae.1